MEKQTKKKQMVSLIFLEIMSIVALLASRFRTSLVNSMSIVVFVISLVSFGLVARTGYLGVQIRHTEIASGTFQSNSATEGGEQDGD